MTERHSRKITFDIPLTINLYPIGLYNPNDQKTRDRGWEIIDELSERDVENALLSIFAEYSDGREPLPCELIRREFQSLVTDAIWLVIGRRMREKHPTLPYKMVRDGAESKSRKLKHHTTFASTDDVAKRRGVDPDGNFLDGPW